MMNHSRRGAAKISVVWMITVVVLFLVSFAMAVVAFQDQSKAEEVAQAARDSEQRQVELASEESRAHVELTRAVGWFDREAGSPRTDKDLLVAALDETKTSFGLGDDVQHIEDLLPQVRQSYLAVKKEINTLKQQIDQLQSEKTSLDQQMRQSLSQKDTEIANLRRQVSDAEQAATDKQQELEGRVDDLRTRNNELDAEKRRLEADIDALARTSKSEVQSLMVRLDTMAQKLNFVEKAAETADARVLEVSENLALAWIDIGARQRLAPGTRFRVVDGRPGSRRVKAWATVTRVEPTMAEVALSDLADRFDPVVTGDVVYNPLYDPTGRRYAVLAGRFSGSFNEKELRGLLDGMNITVQDELDILTDYLIVGAEMYTDPETKEPLEDPLPPSELAVYKEAQARGGITIIPIKDVRSYFKF